MVVVRSINSASSSDDGSSSIGIDSIHRYLVVIYGGGVL